MGRIWTLYEELLIVEGYSKWPRQWRLITDHLNRLVSSSEKPFSITDVKALWMKSFPKHPSEAQQQTILWVFGQIIGTDKNLKPPQLHIYLEQAKTQYASKKFEPTLEAILEDASKGRLLAPPRVEHPKPPQEPPPPTPQTMHQGLASGLTASSHSGASSSHAGDSPPGFEVSFSSPESCFSASQALLNLQWGDNSPGSLSILKDLRDTLITAHELSNRLIVGLATDAAAATEEDSDRVRAALEKRSRVAIKSRELISKAISTLGAVK